MKRKEKKRGGKKRGEEVSMGTSCNKKIMNVHVQSSA